MIIRTNLYWEFAEQPPTNPWKRRGIMAATLVMLLAVGYYYLLTSRLQESRQKALAVEERFTEQRTRLQMLQAQAEEARDRARARTPVIDYALSRVNFAPILEEILASAPANVEFSRLRLRSDGQRGFRLQLSGSGAGGQPRLVCDKLRIQLVDALSTDFPAVEVNFDNLEESTRTITIEGEKRSVADFTISVISSNAAHGN